MINSIKRLSQTAYRYQGQLVSVGITDWENDGGWPYRKRSWVRLLADDSVGFWVLPQHLEAVAESEIFF